MMRPRTPPASPAAIAKGFKKVFAAAKAGTPDVDKVLATT
jgi:hypothetical protein